MTVAIEDVGRRGRLDIGFALCNGRTVIRHSYCEVPFKITRLLDADVPGRAHLILMQCTPGLFGGDDIECAIHVDSGARVVISQQSAAKIHPSADLPAKQSIRIDVASGAELVIDMEPVIPFAGSRLHQATRIEVEPGARLVFWECLMAGRIGKDELWQFEELSSETRLDVAGRPLYLDRFSLKPSLESPDSDWIMKSSGYVGTGLVFTEGAGQLAKQLHDAIPDAGVDLLSPNLVAVRVVAASGPDFHRHRQMFVKLSAKFVRSQSEADVPQALARQ